MVFLFEFLTNCIVWTSSVISIDPFILTKIYINTHCASFLLITRHVKTNQVTLRSLSGTKPTSALCQKSFMHDFGQVHLRKKILICAALKNIIDILLRCAEYMIIPPISTFSRILILNRMSPKQHRTWTLFPLVWCPYLFSFFALHD